MSLPVAVIIPCAGRVDWLELCLDGVAALDPAPAEVVVVDSACREDVQSLVANYQGIRLVAGIKGSLLSSGRARNMGVEHTSAAWLAFLDADCVPETDWLSLMEQEEASVLKMISGPVTDLFPKNPVTVADNMLQFGEYNLNRPQGPVAHATSCNLLVRRDIFIEVGGFPDHYPIEDILFSQAVVKKVGNLAVYHPCMRVRHAGRDTFTAYLNHQYDFGFARSAHAVLVSDFLLRLARHAVLIPVVALHRLVYIYRRLAHWKLLRWTHVAYLFWVIPGLMAWAYGFQQGSKAYYRGRHSNE